MNIIKSFLSIICSRKVIPNVPYGIIRSALKDFMRERSFGTFSIFGTDHVITIQYHPTGKNVLYISPMNNRERVADLLDKYEVEYSFPKGKAKVYFFHRIPERKNGNVISLPELLDILFKELFVVQQKYGLYLKTPNLEFESKVLKRVPRQ
jgi:hypothetical protein